MTIIKKTERMAKTGFLKLTDDVLQSGASSAISATASIGIDWLNTQFGNGFRGSGVKFYWNKDMHGGILDVVVSSAFTTMSGMLKDYALEQYKNLIGLNKSGGVEGVNPAVRIISDGYLNSNEKDPSGRQVKESQYGVMSVGNGDNITALDCYGNKCVDALMLKIPLKTPIKVTRRFATGNGATSQIKEERLEHVKPIISNYLVWYDCTAIVNPNSKKNIIVTKVSGRDYSRKEFISNGDIEFTVSGRINSNIADVYPENEIKKFKQVMDYKGLIEVNNQVLNTLGVQKILVLDWDISPQRGYKNMQEYTFHGIGIMPPVEVRASEDTITYINSAIASESSENSGWSALLSNKLEGLKEASVGILDQGASTAIGILDNDFIL